MDCFCLKCFSRLALTAGWIGIWNDPDPTRNVIVIIPLIFYSMVCMNTGIAEATGREGNR